MTLAASLGVNSASLSSKKSSIAWVKVIFLVLAVLYKPCTKAGISKSKVKYSNEETSSGSVPSGSTPFPNAYCPTCSNSCLKVSLTSAIKSLYAAGKPSGL